MSRLVIIAPVMPPVPGGGGVYYSLMRDEMLRASLVEEITVVTERLPRNYPLTPVNDEKICRVLPPKHSLPRLGFHWLLGAARQAMALGGTQDLLESLRPTHLVVHSSFHNRPTGIGRLLKIAGKLKEPPRLACDVRDPLLPRSRFRTLDAYHVVIACSDNVAIRLRQLPRAERVVQVPIPISVTVPSHALVRTALERYGLNEKEYLFNASGLQGRKGLFCTLAVVEELWQRGKKVPLVVAGGQRVAQSRLKHFLRRGILRYLGPIPPAMVAPLSVGAALDVNFSSVDSMPRHTLEALAAGARVTLPPGVPEFLPECSPWVAPEGIEEAATFLERMLADYAPPPYDASPHQPDAVFREFATQLALNELPRH